MTPEQIAAWPGKTSDMGTHPALWHMLDVGAVATRLLVARPLFGDMRQDHAAAFLIALHDLGKISTSFRDMLLGRPYRGAFRHWQHSYLLLQENDALLGELLGGEEAVREVLYGAVAGHHGGPPERLEYREAARERSLIGTDALAAARDAITTIAPLFQGASLAGLDIAEAKRLSWALSGQTVQADWIGSNIDWFVPRPATISVPDYWREALATAEGAISQAGLFHARPAPGGAANVLAGRAPRPMQAAVADIALPEGATLALIEDATGAGKTEAALILASRMMAAGKGRGIYFALPTMATSNAMLSRLEAITPRLFEGRPTLALTHGKARMNDLFRAIRGRDGSDPGAGPTCGKWLADDRRRVLLADVGVGTVDQALLAVLPTRFNTLRLRALSDHILIVDEAHSYDPYMERQLRRLLEFHAMLGGSAILMTATLPREMRAGFVAAFERGRIGPTPSGDPPPQLGNAYPMLSVVGARCDSRRPAPVPATCRDVAVHRLSRPDDAEALLVAGAEAGAACVWVRNAVDDAIGACAALRARGIHADLLHARFAVADRLGHEKALQARFGRDGMPADRAGRVLVATQVVEASLDLDFDLMVSDLAPIGSLIQRAGRLWRHMDLRPADTRPVAGPALHVLSPDPDKVETTRWLHQVLEGGAWVYPQDVVWRTARALFDAGAIRAPHGLRPLIEAVHGTSPTPLPAALEQAEIESQGRMMSEAQQALNALLDPWAGYSQPQAQKVFDDDRFPTRLGMPQITLRLALWAGDMLVPWAGPGPFGWQMSEVQISRARYEKLQGPAQDSAAIEAVKQDWPKWARENIIVAPVGEDATICEGLRYERESGIVFAP